MDTDETITGIRLSKRSYHSDISAHLHDYHQVVLPSAGQLQLQCGQHTGSAAATHAALIPAGETHSFSAEGENAFWVLDVPTDTRHDALFESAVRAPFRSLAAATKSQLQYADLEPALLRDPLMQHHWVQLLLTGIEQQPKALVATKHKRLQLALDALEKQLHLPLSVSAIARAAHLSTSQLHRLFRQELCCTPQDRATAMRMHRAENLLQSGLTLLETALACGYADQSSFGKAFKRHHGLTPAAWRRRQLG